VGQHAWTHMSTGYVQVRQVVREFFSQQSQRIRELPDKVNGASTADDKLSDPVG
jgi:hypothetical protein